MLLNCLRQKWYFTFLVYIDLPFIIHSMFMFFAASLLEK